MTGGESLIYLEGCPLQRPQLAKLSQDRVTLVVEGHSGEFPDGFLRSARYAPLPFHGRALQEGLEIGMSRHTSAGCLSLVDSW